MKKVYALIAAAATVVATVFATSACFLIIYQPKEPVSLRDE